MESKSVNDSLNLLSSSVHVCLLLSAIMVAALTLSSGLLWLWREEPFCLRQPLYLDYTESHPSASVSLSIPMAHTFKVSLTMLLPESPFNLHLGVFQVEILLTSSNGTVLMSSSQPCMLRFKSFPFRVVSQAQKIILSTMEYRERNPRTEGMRVTVKPRAGTRDIPEIYSVEVHVNSKLPRGKDLAYSWKWTFYVWVSLYLFVLLVGLLLCCCRAMIFQRMSRMSDDGELSEEEHGDVRGVDGVRQKGKVHAVSRPLLAFSEGGESSRVFDGEDDDNFGASSGTS